MSDDRPAPMAVVRGEGGTLSRGGEPPEYTGPPVPLNHHLLRLQARAETGDELAAHELQRWVDMFGRHPSNQHEEAPKDE